MRNISYKQHNTHQGSRKARGQPQTQRWQKIIKPMKESDDLGIEEQLKIKGLVNETDKPLTNLTKGKEEVAQSTIKKALRAHTPKSYKNLRRMGAFLNAYHLSKLKAEDMSNLN